MMFRIDPGARVTRRPGPGRARTEVSGLAATGLDRLAEQVLARSSLPARRPVAVVTGPVGTGKTTVLQELGEFAAARGARLLRATGSAAEHDIPYEVVRQLLRGAGRVHRGGGPADGDAGPRTAAALGAVLLDLAAEGPLCVVVDDVHQADVPSLRCLAYVARRLADEPVLLALGEAPRVRPRHPEAYAELLRAAPLHRARLRGLTGTEVRALVAGALGAAAAGELGPDVERVGAGNPLLVDALLEDARTAPGRVGAGEAFRDAALACLYRCEPAVVTVARALAVTGWPATDPRLPELLDEPAAAALRSVHAATTAGLVTGGRLRDPAVTEAVLDGMPLDERAALHRRVAGLLHRDGAAAALTAPHLVRAGEPTEPWMAETLLAAAEQERRAGRPEPALRYLRRLHRAGTHPDLAGRVTAALAGAEWRVDPGGAARHLDPVADEVRAGRLGVAEATPTIGRLLWLGRVEEAVELAGHARGAAAGADPEATAELSVALRWMGTLYPGTRTPGTSPAAHRRDPATLLLVRRRLRGAGALRAVLRRGGDGRAVAEAGHVLATVVPDEATLWDVVSALTALLHADRLAEVEHWCARLTAGPAARDRPTVTAVVTALRAAAAVRGGDPAAGYRLGRSALDALSPRGWGIAAALPLVACVRACVATGRLDEAAELLRRPVPGALLESPLGLTYLHARGRYSLAAGRPDSALDDFHLCGHLMTDWRFDVPALVPWRTEAALACLELGRRGRAARLVREELGLLRPGHQRRRGAALRVLAATTDASPARLRMLREAVPLLEVSRDRLELIGALTDLGRAYQEVGDQRGARTAARTAQLLAERCGVPREPVRPPSRPVDADPPPSSALPLAGLSTAEARVAALAAQGHTNREIAGTLFVAVGTVEQRLTRVYRKLDVNSRAELAVRLRPGGPDPAGPRRSAGRTPAGAR